MVAIHLKKIVPTTLNRAIEDATQLIEEERIRDEDIAELLGVDVDSFTESRDVENRKLDMKSWRRYRFNSAIYSIWRGCTFPFRIIDEWATFLVGVPNRIIEWFRWGLPHFLFGRYTWRSYEMSQEDLAMMGSVVAEMSVVEDTSHIEKMVKENPEQVEVVSWPPPGLFPTSGGLVGKIKNLIKRRSNGKTHRSKYRA